MFFFLFFFLCVGVDVVTGAPKLDFNFQVLPAAVVAVFSIVLPLVVVVVVAKRSAI